MGLFEGPPTANDPPTEGTVSALVLYGYKEKTVRQWPAARASAKLREERRRAEIVKQRATEKANEVCPEEAGEATIRPPLKWEREGCADWIETASSLELPAACAAGLWSLTDEELKQFAELLAHQLRMPMPKKT